MKVVSIDPAEHERAKRKQDLLEVLEEMRTQVEAGEIVEFVATSIDQDGETQIHASVADLPSAVGLYEIGKHMIIQQEAY